MPQSLGMLEPGGTATFMIAGDRMHSAPAAFCAVATAKPFALEVDEPMRVAEATRRMRLKLRRHHGRGPGTTLRMAARTISAKNH